MRQNLRPKWEKRPFQAIPFTHSLSAKCEGQTEPKKLSLARIERVELSTRASTLIDRFQGIGAFCERLLHSSIVEEGERSRQKRLLQVLFAAPFIGLAVTLQILLQIDIASSGVAVAPLVLGFALLAPLALIATGKGRVIEAVSLVAGIIGIAMIIAFGGGVQSPFATLALALVVEPCWVVRERKAAGVGVLGAVVALLIAAGLSSAGISAAAPSAWQWLVPLAYGVSVFGRVSLGSTVDAEQHRPSTAETVALANGAVLLRLQVNGDVVEADARAQSVLGVAPELLLGGGLFERVLVSDRISYLSALADFREGKTTGSLRLRIRVPADLNLRLGAVYHMFAAEMSQGTHGEILMVLRDDQKTSQLEASLVEAKSEVDAVTRTRDELLATVSHEMRTPLNAIVGFSDVLVNEMFGPFANEKQREYVALIKQAGSHLLNVVNVVLDVSKVQAGAYAGDIEEFELEATAKLVLAMIAGEANAKALNLGLDLAEDIGLVRCDRRALQQVMINLLSNAVKFTPQGDVCLSARKRGQRLFLTVSDTGIGIAPDDLSRIGQPFTQIKNEHTHKGTGLGLALVKGLVQASGGSLSIESALGAGTKVHVSLPVGEAPHQVDADERKSGANSSGEWNEIPYRKTA